MLAAGGQDTRAARRPARCAVDADAVIVASTLKRDGVWWNPVDEARVRAFMGAVE